LRGQALRLERGLRRASRQVERGMRGRRRVDARRLGQRCRKWLPRLGMRKDRRARARPGLARPRLRGPRLVARFAPAPRRRRLGGCCLAQPRGARLERARLGARRLDRGAMPVAQPGEAGIVQRMVGRAADGAGPAIDERGAQPLGGIAERRVELGEHVRHGV
jgi:hypothetical protein